MSRKDFSEKEGRTKPDSLQRCSDAGQRRQGLPVSKTAGKAAQHDHGSSLEEVTSQQWQQLWWTVQQLPQQQQQQQQRRRRLWRPHAARTGLPHPPAWEPYGAVAGHWGLAAKLPCAVPPWGAPGCLCGQRQPWGGMELLPQLRGGEAHGGSTAHNFPCEHIRNTHCLSLLHVVGCRAWT
jgi:hypothetical protein